MILARNGPLRRRRCLKMPLSGDSSSGEQPRWQPLSRLALVGSIIDEGLADAKHQYAFLLEAKHVPHVLDDHTVERTLQVYGDTHDDLWVFEEQMQRWGRKALTPAQRREAHRPHTRMGTRRESEGGEPSCSLRCCRRKPCGGLLSGSKAGVLVPAIREKAREALVAVALAETAAAPLFLGSVRRNPDCNRPNWALQPAATRYRGWEWAVSSSPRGRRGSPGRGSSRSP